MEQSAAKNACYSDSFAALNVDHGSLVLTAPLSAFLDRCMSAPDLRKSVRDSLPALLADIAHFLNVSHGRHPGVIDHAAAKMVGQESRDWLIHATNAFVAERALLNKLTVAAGPIRRHANQDKIEALLAMQHRSFAMLASSDRNGCPAGAALAFVMDWRATRPLLERTALILDVEFETTTLPEDHVSLQLANFIADNPAMERAMNFGASQLLAQQKGLWQLIVARHDFVSSL